VAISLDRLTAVSEKVLVDPEWVVAFIGPFVPHHIGLGLDAHLFWRRPELDTSEIVYLTVATAQARGWLPPELTTSLGP
jgi:hypothetical protein